MYYFSGVDRAGFVELLAREGTAGMVNASVAEQPAMLATYSRYPEVPLVLDSGAFQGNSDIDGYIELCNRIGDRFRWVANLDVIGDQERSNEHWTQLQYAGINALWIYQIDGGDDLDVMYQNALLWHHIGIGGLVPVLRTDTARATELISSIGERLERAGARAHFFGVGTPSILAEFAHKSWFSSADSQSWLCGFKDRELIARDGRRVKCQNAGFELTREECARQNVRQIHAWMSGEPLQLGLLSGY